mgnify:CR=1 FL=1
MRVLLEGLHFSPYALLLEVVENEFTDEVAPSDREAFCRELFPYLKTCSAVTTRRMTPSPCRPNTTCSIRS